MPCSVGHPINIITVGDNPLYMPSNFVDDDSDSIGGGSISRQFRNPLYDYDNDELERELAASNYEPGEFSDASAMWLSGLTLMINVSHLC